MSASNHLSGSQLGTPQLGEPFSYLKLVCHVFDKKQEELEQLEALADRHTKALEVQEGMPVQTSRAKKLINRFLSRYFHLSHLCTEELEALIEIASERIGNSFGVLKPFLALIQWTMDMNDLFTQKFQPSQFMKAFVSTCLVGGSILVFVAALGACEVVLRALALVQIFVAVSLVVRSIVELYQVRQEKIRNQVALADNTARLSELAGKINVVLADKNALESWMKESKDPSKTTIGYSSRVQNNVSRLIERLKVSEADSDYIKARTEFTQALQERLELEKERDAIKKEYHHVTVDVFIGLNNVLAAAVSLFFMASVGLGLAGGSILATLIDFKYSGKKRAEEKMAMNGSDKDQQEAHRAKHYATNLMEGLNNTAPKSLWQRFLSLGTRRAATSLQSSQRINNALTFMDALHQNHQATVVADLATDRRSASMTDKALRSYRTHVSDESLEAKGTLSQMIASNTHGNKGLHGKPDEWTETLRLGA